jgi:Putative prokaryotic signal transducing protein
MQQWHLLYKTRNATEASIIQGMLAENFIPVQIMNKQDSSYLNFGDIEIHVPINLKDVAKSLLDKALLN